MIGITGLRLQREPVGDGIFQLLFGADPGERTAAEQVECPKFSILGSSSEYGHVSENNLVEDFRNDVMARSTVDSRCKPWLVQLRWPFLELWTGRSHKHRSDVGCGPWSITGFCRIRRGTSLKKIGRP